MSALALTTACTFAPVDQPDPKPTSSSTPAEGSTGAIDRFRQLLIVDPTVLGDSRADDATDGAPFSFRSRFEWIAGSPDGASRMVSKWLTDWSQASSVGGDAVTPRPALLTDFLARWSPPEDAGAGASLATAPFRLIAIVNRLDLRTGDCSGSAGELRFVYGAVDPTTSRPIDMAVIFEIPYPRTRNANSWAVLWAGLFDLPFGEPLNVALERLTQTVESEANPVDVRVRTDEVAFGGGVGLPWELREFHVERTDAATSLVENSLASTPRSGTSASVLAPLVDRGAPDVFSGFFELPDELRAGAARVPSPTFEWTLPTLDAELASVFSESTCNGCHGGNTASLPFQHLRASADGSHTEMSRFLNDPDGGPDDLGRRERDLATLLSTACGGGDAVYVE